MPMYEYGCLACNSRFDRLRRMDQDDSGVICPRCGGEQVQRRLSIFAAHTRGAPTTAAETTSTAPTSHGGCGSGCCGRGCASRN
ncbi:MAG: zinc ribbon domain-containing protein [Chloroflexales bacterium]|nr:zinc ribbon domain-containing protein [Chloroflexales bacterium]